MKEKHEYYFCLFSGRDDVDIAFKRDDIKDFAKRQDQSKLVDSAMGPTDAQEPDIEAESKIYAIDKVNALIYT